MHERHRYARRLHGRIKHFKDKPALTTPRKTRYPDVTTWTYTVRFPWQDDERVEKNSGGTTLASATFTYDCARQSNWPKRKCAQTWTLYDGGNPIMDFNGSGSLTMRYLWGPTGSIARQSSGGTVSWYIADALGTVREIVNNSGSIIDHLDFSAFGAVLGETSPTSGDRMTGFAMLERDAVTALNLAVYRQENPGTGRWDSQDPQDFGSGDSDLYRYAGNYPSGEVDPNGLQGSLIDKKKFPKEARFTLANPEQTLVLIGPPHKNDPNDPHQYVRKYFRQKGVPDENIIEYKNLADLKRQLAQRRQQKRGRLDVVVWNHGRPGAIGVQYDPSRQGAACTDQESLNNLKELANILYKLNPWNLYFTGCSTCMFANGGGWDESLPFFKHFQHELPTDTFIWGSQGSFSTGPSNDDDNAPIGIYIEPGGNLQVPISPYLPKSPVPP